MVDTQTSLRMADRQRTVAARFALPRGRTAARNRRRCARAPCSLAVTLLTAAGNAILQAATPRPRACGHDRRRREDETRCERVVGCTNGRGRASRLRNRSVCIRTPSERVRPRQSATGHDAADRNAAARTREKTRAVTRRTIEYVRTCFRRRSRDGLAAGRRLYVYGGTLDGLHRVIEHRVDLGVALRSAGNRFTQRRRGKGKANAVRAATLLRRMSKSSRHHGRMLRA
jgi:hypothetical protein